MENNFNMPDIWPTMPHSSTVTIKQNVLFRAWLCPEKIRLDQFYNGPSSAIINFNMPDIWQTTPDS